MTDEIKRNIKLIKFGYQFKYCVFMSIFFINKFIEYIYINQVRMLLSFWVL